MPPSSGHLECATLDLFGSETPANETSWTIPNRRHTLCRRCIRACKVAVCPPDPPSGSRTLGTGGPRDSLDRRGTGFGRRRYDCRTNLKREGFARRSWRF